MHGEKNINSLGKALILIVGFEITTQAPVPNYLVLIG